MTTVLRKCTAGDLVTLPALTLTAADGYDVDNATIRVMLYSGPASAPTSTKTFEREPGTDTDNLVLEDGELEITILATDWPESWAEAARLFELTVEVEVEFPAAGGPETLPRATLRVLPQAIRPAS